MSDMLFNFWNRRAPSFGHLAFAAFLVAALSGIPLSFSYNVEQASDSLQLLMLTSPSGIYFRALHYWSGQIFLLATLIHVIEHLSKESELSVKPGLWLRLMLILILAFFVMLSGFILKADAEGEMARQILTGLLNTIPLFGPELQTMVLGGNDSLVLIYVHHLVTTTLVIALVIFEHVRRAWPELLSYVYIMGISGILAVLLPQGLHLADGFAVRGPWYFIGLQELLHWIPQPLIVVAFLALLAGLIAYLRWMKRDKALLLKKALLGLLVGYIIITVNNWALRDGNWNSLLF